MSESLKSELRIGVYVCRCGLNIGGTVDCESVARFAEGIEDVVVSRDNQYTCSEPGQQLIQNDIREYRLNRVVVASCSPRLHEPTFRRACSEAGLNPYLMEMANIREHCSWVHYHQPKEATEKAKDLVKMAISRARKLESQEELRVPITKSTLVIGGGVAGIQAALDLADSGYQVYLVEKKPSIGGIMAQLDKVFPTIDCSICILGPKMMDVGRHPRIKMFTLSEVISISGYVGNFNVKIHKKARLVDEKECTACGDCTKECPVVKPDEFDMGLSSRKAVYIPFPQAVPSAYIINKEECLGSDPVICGKCIRLCEKGCIDFDMKDEEIEFTVGTIIVATGMDVYDPEEMDEYGYTRYENVITSMEFERLINAGGPTKGDFYRLTDLKTPRSIAFIQCVGSRSVKKGGIYCSNICCMNTVKDTLILKEHYPGMDVKVFYIDIRAFGKGFEDLFRRSKVEGVRYIRGLPGQIREDPDTKNLILLAENTATNKLEEYEVEMVVLSLGVKPPEDDREIQNILALQKTSDGFYLEAHPKLQPVDSATKGVFLAGCAESPKDIKDSVTQASASAARAIRLMSSGEITIEATTASVDKDNCKICGICVKVCPYNAITMDKDNEIPARVNEAACAGCGTCAAECPTDAITMRHFTNNQIESQIDSLLEEYPANKILAFACNWCSYAGADFAGISRLQYPPQIRLVRTMCSGRVDKKFIWRAFEKGAPVVMVSGCHIGDCHYINANHWTQKRVEKIWKKMEKLGIRPERLQLEWISAAEGVRFSRVMEGMEKLRVSVTQEEIEETKKILRKENGGK